MDYSLLVGFHFSDDLSDSKMETYPARYMDGRYVLNLSVFYLFFFYWVICLLI